MKTPTILVFSALWYGRANARNETILYGWQADPNVRGTWTILWSCLATIFICTWSALHLTVPRRHDWWYLMLRKAGWMCIAATAPEVVLLHAAENFFLAQKLSKHLKDQDRTEWTLTHMLFAIAGGFRTRRSNGETSTITAEKLRELIETDQTPDPPISAEELRSRSKSDCIIKTAAIFQIIWFGIQILFRAIQHFQTTALEVMTVAFVFCSISIYAFYFYLPQDVEFPVMLDLPERTPLSEEPAPIADRPGGSPVTKGHAFKTSAIEKSASMQASRFIPGWIVETTFPLTLFVAFACAFGTIHCLGWNSPFPTGKERVAWRVCSVSTTALPLVLPLQLSTYILMDPLDKGDKFEDAKDVTFVFLGPAIALSYVVGRITLIVLAFMALRASPADTYQTVGWNQYIPHFAAA